MAFRVMDESDRTVIIGQTGSGKTFGGLWQLSLQPLDEFPWIIIDWKNDDKIAQIPYTTPITLDDEPPIESGLYVLRPISAQEDNDARERERTDSFLRRVWERGECGLFVDEGMMLKGSRPFRNIMIQGRSKHIPCITLTQLPVDVPRPVFTEATFIQVYYVQDRRYRKVIEEFTPLEDTDIDRLKPFYSYYCDLPNRQVTMLKPAPSIEETMSRFEEMLRPPEDVNGEVPAQEPSKFSRSPI